MTKQLFLVLVIVFSGFALKAQHRKKVAVIKEHETGKYTYTVGNGSDWSINYFLSTDSIKWEQFNLEPSHQAVLHYDNEKLWFRLNTTHGRQVLYKIPGNITYKIYYNPDTDKFDLLKFEGPAYMDQ